MYFSYNNTIIALKGLFIKMKSLIIRVDSHQCHEKTPATFFQVATFLQYSTSSSPNLSNTNSKYLNSVTCSNFLPSTLTSHTHLSSLFNTITLLLSAFAVRPLILYILTKYLIITLTFSSSTRSCVYSYDRPNNLHSLPSSENPAIFSPF